jgi:choice-of-anchor B domain-containing protein
MRSIRHAALLSAALVVGAPAAATSGGLPDSAALARTPKATTTPFVRSGFGAAVVLADGIAYVGRPGEFSLFPIPANRPGAVHVFAPAGGEWRETAVIRAEDGSVGDRFGAAVAVEGDWMVVGAPGMPGGGAAYLFEREDGVWTQVRRLAMGGTVAGAEFGSAVALADGVALVGAPGAGDGAGSVAVFGRAGREGAALAGDLGDLRFGTAIAARGTRVAVGAPGPAIDPSPFTGPPEYRPGAALVFERGDSGWVRTGRLELGATTPAGLGSALVVLNDGIVASAPLDAQGQGRLHRFALDTAGAWSHAGPLSIDSLPPQALLGMTLAGDDDVLLVGAPLHGLAVLLGRDAGGGWHEVTRIHGTGPTNFLGAALALEGDRAVVGAPGEDMFAGAGHVWTRGPEGAWTEVSSLVDGAASPPAVVGREPIECASGRAEGFGCREVDLVAFVPIEALGGGRGVMVNDLWGWTDPESGREYALVGRTDGVAFLDLGDPSSPVYLGELPLTEGATPNLWRDVKVYADHAFIVSDGAGAHGVQVFDLRRLRDIASPPVTFDETARYDGIFSAHNIVINEDTGFAYVVGASMGGTTCGGGLHMIDVRDPAQPTFAGCFQDPSTGLAGTGYSHDAQCVNYRGPDPDWEGREICLGANENALSIADVTDKSAPVAISTARYPSSAYLHQGWLSEDHRYFFMNDEGDEVAGLAPFTRTLVWDVEDLDDPVLLTEHDGTTTASDHNLYVRGDLMYQSNYVSGLRVLDISDPAQLEEIAFFDTLPEDEDRPGFAGSWSNYPFFESGLVTLTSMREGFFVVRVRERRPVF